MNIEFTHEDLLAIKEIIDANIQDNLEQVMLLIDCGKLSHSYKFEDLRIKLIDAVINANSTGGQLAVGG